MIQVTGRNFKDEVFNFEGIVVADFYADWCGPCKMLSPLMEEMSKTNNNKDVKFVKINVDAEPELAGQFGIMSIPTVVFFKNGKKVSQKVGLASREDYEHSVKETLAFDPAKVTKRSVKVFSTPTCPYCHMVKEYLKEKKIEFEDIDVSKDQAQAVAMVQRYRDWETATLS